MIYCQHLQRKHLKEYSWADGSWQQRLTTAALPQMQSILSLSEQPTGPRAGQPASCSSSGHLMACIRREMSNQRHGGRFPSNRQWMVSPPAHTSTACVGASLETSFALPFLPSAQHVPCTATVPGPFVHPLSSVEQADLRARPAAATEVAEFQPANQQTQMHGTP